MRRKKKRSSTEIKLTTTKKIKKEKKEFIHSTLKVSIDFHKIVDDVVAFLRKEEILDLNFQ